MIFATITIVPYANFIGPNSFLLNFGGLIGGLLTLGIPLFGMLVLFTKRFTNFKLKAGWKKNLWMIWGASAVIFVATIISTVAHFQSHSSIHIEKEYPLSDEVIRISSMSNNSGSYWANFDGLRAGSRGLISDNIRIKVVKGKSDLLVVNKEVHSSGKDRRDAKQKAAQAIHEIKVEGNEIFIPDYFLLKRGSKMRGQEVLYELSIPKGMEVEFDKSVFALNVKLDKDDSFESPRRTSGHIWEMGENGLFAGKWLEENSFEKIYDFKDFSHLNIEGNIQTEIVYGKDYSMKIIGAKEYSKSVEVVSTNNTLSVIAPSSNYRSLKLFVTMPQLESVHLMDAEDIRIQGFVQNAMEIVKNGRFDVKAYVDIQNLKLDLKGRGLTTLIGKGKQMDLKISDYSKLDAERYIVENMDFSGRRYKRSSVNVTNTFNYKENHNLNLQIFGDPQMVARSNKESN